MRVFYRVFTNAFIGRIDAVTFRFQHGRAGRVPTAADLPTLQRLRTKLLVDECGMSADVVQAVVTDDALRDLCGERESSPVCAIVGGIMAQDVIRTVSG